MERDVDLVFDLGKLVCFGAGLLHLEHGGGGVDVFVALAGHHRSVHDVEQEFALGLHLYALVAAFWPLLQPARKPLRRNRAEQVFSLALQRLLQRLQVQLVCRPLAVFLLVIHDLLGQDHRLLRVQTTLAPFYWALVVGLRRTNQVSWPV